MGKFFNKTGDLKVMREKVILVNFRFIVIRGKHHKVTGKWRTNTATGIIGKGINFLTYEKFS